MKSEFESGYDKGYKSKTAFFPPEFKLWKSKDWRLGFRRGWKQSIEDTQLVEDYKRDQEAKRLKRLEVKARRGAMKRLRKMI
jgi:hypothetical protein